MSWFAIHKICPGLLHPRQQLSEFQQGGAVNGWAFGRANAGANDLVKHPCGDAARRIVGKPNIHKVSLAACGSKHFERRSKQRMEGVAKF